MKPIKAQTTSKAVPRALMVLQSDMGTRSCVNCVACCVAYDVTFDDGSEKAAGVPCPKLDNDGRCSIYADRPKACRDFRCLWLDGMGEARDNPSNTGAVIAAQVTSMPIVAGDAVVPGAVGAMLRAMSKQAGRQAHLVMSETSPGSLGHSALALADRIAEAAPVFLMFRNGARRVISNGRSAAVKRINEAIAAHNAKKETA